jgi:ATP-dependent DNA helicase RecG
MREYGKITFDDVMSKLSLSEDTDVEFKSAKGGLPGSLWQTYSAMANTNGGVILLGVENDGTVSGISDLQKMKKSFWDTLNNRGKVSLNLLTDQDVQEIAHPRGTILSIQVPRATRLQRPVFVNVNPLTGTYRRNYEGDYHCTQQEVSRMLSDQGSEPADSRIVEGFEMADLDLPSLQQYRQRFASFKPAHPWLSESDQGLLTKLGGWRHDRKASVSGLTVAGILMFGKDEAIREAVPQYHVDYREMLSDDPSTRWTDRLFPDGAWAANLFQFYLRVIQRLSADLKLPFQLDPSDLFRKGETVVHEAIREALVNALIHADYQGQGGVLVEKYRNQFQFSNPGTLLVSFEQLLRGNISECRNKSLQQMFMMIGAAEKAGSGVDKIRQGWNSQHWRSPNIQEQVQPDRVRWLLPMVSMIPEESLARLKIMFGSKVETFSSIEVQALVTADLEKEVTNDRLRQITGAHASDLTKALQSLVARQFLIQERSGRWTKYHLPLPDSIHKAVDSIHSDGDSIHKGKDSIHKDYSASEWDALKEIARPAHEKKRVLPEDMGRLILQLCSGRYLTLAQLGELLARNPVGIRSRHLKPLVKKGLLRLRYPDKPNRVDQAYQTIQQPS